MYGSASANIWALMLALGVVVVLVVMGARLQESVEVRTRSFYTSKKAAGRIDGRPAAFFDA